MKIGIQTWGSDGDIRPFIALAGGLSSAGHEVTLVVTSADGKNYSSLAEALKFHIIYAGDTNSESYNKSIDLTLQKFIEERNSLQKLKIVLDSMYFPFVNDMYKASKTLCEKSDIVIGHFILHTLNAAARKLNRPYISATLHGDLISKYTPPSGLPDFGRMINPLLWKLGQYVVNKQYLKSINELCEKENILPFKDVFKEAWESKTLNLIAVSSVFHKPQKDWPVSRKICGFFDIPTQSEGWNKPEDLIKFLESGPKPVYMTQGSTSSKNNPLMPKMAKIMVDAAKMAKTRAIIQTRWEDIADMPHDPDIYRITKAPHHLIFPHCSLVVHHGGAGTTHSATYSGCPSIVIAYFADQFAWAKELKRLGIAPKNLTNGEVTAEKLAREIRFVLGNPDMKKKAEKLGEFMRKENGVGRAIELIEEQFGGSPK